MTGNITVEEAIKKGHLTVSIPAIVIVAGAISLSCLLPLWKYFAIPIPGLIMAALVVAVIFRGKAITKWRVWAFDSVSNVHELKRRASHAMLIPGKGNEFLENLEIWSRADRVHWQQLQQKFSQEDIFVDDPDIPEAIVIRFSKLKKYFYLFLSLISLGVGGLWVFFPKDNPTSASAIWSYVWGTLVIGFAGLFFFISIRDLINRSPQLTIGNSGIQRAGEVLFSWSVIADEKVVKKGYGRNTSFHLTYTYPHGTADIDLDGLDISWTKLDRLIRVYRNRFMVANTERR